MGEISYARQIFEPYLKSLIERLNSDQLTPAELTSLCLLPRLISNPNRLQKSRLNEKKSSSSIIQFMQNYSWKGYADRARRSLIRWHEGRYPLLLTNDIPSPHELLKIQSQGQRVITVFFKLEDWQKTHHDKSAWDFIVHDLIHADHFFENDHWKKGQIDFYQFILKHWDSEIVQQLSQFCPDQFNYLISDMNSHPDHLRKTFQALCLIARKKKNGLDVKTRLPAFDENQFQKEMSLFL